ncbi:MAG TPA: aminotransferase class V-fold PLP-dependent enzyme [Longimicrobiales bacterium]
MTREDQAAHAAARARVREETLERLRADMSPDGAHALHAVAIRYLARAVSGAGPVSAGGPATEPRAFDAAAAPAGLDAIAAELDALASGANALWHPMYMGHQVAPPLPAAIWTESVIGALNQSLAVREMSPSATPIELGLIEWMASLVWGSNAQRAGGTFTSGGTEAIFTSLLAARNAALPTAAEEGVHAPVALLCGEHAHYAVKRAASEIGLGSQAVITIASRAGRMDVAELERTLDELADSERPVVAVVATAGSTATGAFDPLRDIGELCVARRVWLHVDAAHGGSALLSARHRRRLDGIEHASSVSWDPHKMMLVPLSAGVVLVRDRRMLDSAFGQDAPYLFRARNDADLDSGDTTEQGTRSFMCSRRADALKVWVALRRYGVDGVVALFDGLCERAAELHDLLGDRDGFETMHAPECNILCFRYVGSPRLADDVLDGLNLRLRDAWNASGAGWITTTVLDGKRVLRVVLMNPLTEREHLLRTIDGLALLAREPAIAAPRGLR